MANITFPKTLVDRFEAERTDEERRWLRYGQAFCNFIQEHKIVQDRMFIDRLYNADETTARKMIESRTDYQN